MRVTGLPWNRVSRAGVPFFKKGTVLFSMIAKRGSWVQLFRALMTDEVVARKDVVDAKAIGAGEPFADIALQQGLATQLHRSATVLQARSARFPVARLAGRGRLHASCFISHLEVGGLVPSRPAVIMRNTRHHPR